jgi:hypothetical protein
MAAGAFFERGRHLGTPFFGRSGSVFEPPAFVASFDDIAMMGEAIEQRHRHFGIAKCVRPCAKGEIGGDDNRGPLIETADQVEEQLATGLGKWQVAEFVEDGQVLAGQVIAM